MYLEGSFMEGNRLANDSNSMTAAAEPTMSKAEIEREIRKHRRTAIQCIVRTCRLMNSRDLLNIAKLEISIVEPRI